MSTFNSVLLFVSLSVSLVLFQNCGNTFSANKDSSTDFSFCKAQSKLKSPFQKNKFALKKKTFQTLQKPGASPQKLAAIVDVQCAKNQPNYLNILSQPLSLTEKQQNLKKVAVSISVLMLPNQHEIEDELNNNPCLIGLAENSELKKTQTNTATTLDPASQFQDHLKFVGYFDSLELQREINKKIIVAVIDTGVDYDHFDLKQRMWNDGNGNHGANFAYSNTNDPMDDEGHGTHVSGIISAVENNDFGGVGLTGDYVELMAIKSLDNSGGGTTQAVFDGIQFAIENGADIINMSIEGQGANPILESAIADAINAGVVIITAAGNQSQEITSENLFSPAYIGTQTPGMITVASVDTSNANISNFSNFSAQFVEISAPGSEQSTKAGSGILSTLPNDESGRVAGTSQAAPMVSAAAAMLIGYLKTQNTQYTPEAIESFIKSDGSVISSTLSSIVSGGHIINMGFLAENIRLYFSSNSDGIFNGESTGSSCVIN